MATSGSINYSQTRDQIISDALGRIGVLGEGETATSNAITNCANILNKIVKHWSGPLSIHLWAESDAVVALRDGVNTYTLSSTGDKAGDSPVETDLESDAASGATSLTVTSTTGMTAADNIGIELDDDTRQWTTIVSVDSSTTLTLTAALTSAASSGNTIITYTTQLNRPLDIEQMRYKYAEGNEILMKKYSRAEFMQIVSKSSQGASRAFYYSPQLNSGKLYIWPTPDNCGDRLKITYTRTLEDFDASGDTPDLPQEWYEALTLALAVKVAPSYGIKLSKDFPEILADAQVALAELKAWDSDRGSVYITADC